MKWELIIFDCDGVLVDTEPVANRVLTEVLNELGLPVSYDETVRQFMGLPTATCVEIIESRLGRPAPAGFVEGYLSRLLEAFRQGLRPVHGVTSVLDRINVPTCVASNGDHEKMRLTLGLTGLLPRFKGRMFSVTEVERGKPHPDLFLHAARRMGCAPDTCAVVEDSVFGVQAALAAGMTSFGFAALTDPDALAAAGAKVFSDMSELPALLEEFDPQQH